MQSHFPGIKKTREFHLTIQFLDNYIDEDHVEKIVSALKTIEFEPFEIEMRDALIYPSPFQPRGAWLECKRSDDFLHLSTSIRNSMSKVGFVPDKPFKPHITLGRYKKPPTVRPQIVIGKSHKFIVKNFYLMKSTLTADGAIYEVMQKFG